MKTTSKVIQCMPQVCVGVGEAQCLIAHAICGEDNESAAFEGMNVDKVRYEMLSSLFGGVDCFSICCEKLDDIRTETMFGWGRKHYDAPDRWHAEIFPKGDNDTSVGVNVYNSQTLFFCDSWTLDELYDMDMIDLEDDYDD